MEKVRAYDAATAVAYFAERPDPTMPIDRLHDIVYEQLPMEVAADASAGVSVIDGDAAAAQPRRRCRGKNF